MTLKRNCKDSVFQYLINQNRPYSANDVLQNLHKEFGKTAIQKALDDLSAECRIREKVYGKQKVYSVVQEEQNAGADVALELMTLDSQVEDLNVKLKAAEEEMKTTEGALRVLENEPSTENALCERNQLEETLVTLKERIGSLTKTSNQLTDKDRNEILKNYEYYTKEHRKRKHICMDMINSILENYPKKLKDLFEEIGIETDDIS